MFLCLVYSHSCETDLQNFQSYKTVTIPINSSSPFFSAPNIPQAPFCLQEFDCSRYAI